MLARAAWHYYNDALTQSEIGDRLGVSRIKVSRLLETGRRTGLIQIRINSRFQGCLELETWLKTAFGLKDVRVISDLPDRAVSERLGQAAAQYLMERLEPGDLLALGWGETVSATVQRLGRFCSDRGVDLVSFTGGVGAYVDGMGPAVWKAGFHLLPAPLVVHSAATAAALMSEPAVQNILAMAKRATYGLVGIGALTPAATIVRSGYIARSDVEPFRRQGAVGDLLCRFYDGDGCPLDLPINERVVGIDLASLRALPQVIAVAGGIEKAAAIAAALRGRFAAMLITDEPTAAAVLEREGA